MQNKPLCNLALGDCMTSNRCFLKARKQALQRDFARGLLLCGKEPIPDCTISSVMPLKVFWELLSVFQGCWVLHALLLHLKVLLCFLAFAVASIVLFLLLLLMLEFTVLMLEFTVLNRKLLKDVAQPVASLSRWSRDNQDLRAYFDFLEVAWFLPQN